MSWQNASTRKSWRMRRAYRGIRDHPEITQTEDHSKDENHHEQCRDSQTSNRWTEDQEQNLHSSTRLVDKPQAARHAWEYDEDFTTRWPAKQETARVARPTRIRRNGTIRTGTIRTSAGVSSIVGGPSGSSHRDSWR